MKLKGFLKPEWRKIVIFLVLFVILIGPTIIIESTCVTEFAETPPIYCDFLASIDIVGYRLQRFLFSVFHDSFIDFIAIVILIYLLSCLIVWIYSKVKKK